MKTYQDLLEIGENEQRRMEFVLAAINEHKSSDLYRIAADAELYYRHMNPTIMRAQKFVYNVLGQAVVDHFSANNKIPCRYYFAFVTQAVQFLLGNGVSFNDLSTKERLGQDFDYQVQNAATKALNGGVAYGFWNFDHLEVFGVAGGEQEPAFAPLYDEENGALRAGVRFWQIAPDKPMRATLYEESGYTEYIKRKGENMMVLQDKRAYIQVREESPASGIRIYDGGNYPGFPIVPLFNVNGQSELVGAKETIDAYDLMASALINNIDDGNLIYWVIKNAGGMDDIDDQKFVERLKTVHVTHLEGEEEVDSHSVEAPFEANEAALERLRVQLYDDFMALDVKQIASGAATATQIQAAYEPLNQKTDLFEGKVTEFVMGILRLAGIDDKPTYTRSMIINQQEAVDNVLAARDVLGDKYVAKKILEILGDIDKADEVLEEIKNEPIETE